MWFPLSSNNPQTHRPYDSLFGIHGDPRLLKSRFRRRRFPNRLIVVAGYDSCRPLAVDQLAQSDFASHPFNHAYQIR